MKRETEIEWLPRGAGRGPLANLRVVDLTQQLPGPYATELLGSLGADVIKVEPLSGDAARELDPEMFGRVNRYKRSISLDLKDETDRAKLNVLLEGADAFVEGFRPGVTTRLGCDYQTVRQIRPNIVYCSISGFGQEGPFAQRPTHDLSLQAVVGALPPDADIARIGVPWVDLGTGTTAAFMIVSIWQAGTGGYIDTSMFDTAYSWSRIKPEAVLAVEPTYGTLRSADGHLVVIALLEDAMWVRLCTAFGWSDWQANPEFELYSGRRVHADIIRERVQLEIAKHSAHDIESLSERFDLPLEVVIPNQETMGEHLSKRFGENDNAEYLPVPMKWQQLGESH